jgi:hypothetical protein
LAHDRVVELFDHFTAGYRHRSLLVISLLSSALFAFRAPHCQGIAQIALKSCNIRANAPQRAVRDSVTDSGRLP